MIIKDKTVIFKSLPSIFRKERNGIKPNTVRILTYDEHSEFHKHCINDITIHEEGTKSEFTRKIKDVSIFQPIELSNLFYIYIISWEH